jgi:hypothetical protein
MQNKIQKKIVISLVVFFLSISGVTAQSTLFTGYIRNYSGMLFAGDNYFAIIQNTFNLNIENSKDKVAFKVNPYINHYQNQELELGLRLAYLDILFKSMDIRIGKQQIIWGKADGVFITDVISPKDMREFLLPDFDEIRIGVTALKVDYFLGNNTLEFVFVPAFTPTKLPDQGSIWSPKMEYNLQPAFDNSQKEIAQNLKNSEVFLKFSVLSSAIDFEIMGGYMWDDDPTMHTLKSIDPVTAQVDSITVTPQHHRLGLFGGSFSTTVGSFVIRSEGAYYSGKFFPTIEPSFVDSVVEKNYIHYLLGFDFSLADINMSFQFIQQVILNYNEYISNDEFENTMTFLAGKDFLRETLFLELFAYIGLNNGDSLVRLKATYKLVDGFEILLGTNIFSGNEGRFGQYNDNDMLYMKLKYSF